MKEDRKPLILSSVNDKDDEEKTETSSWWKRFKKWAFLIVVVGVGLFDLVADWQNFIKYVSKPDDLKEFVVTVAVLYFLFCCFIGTAVYLWYVWLAYREFKGYFDEEVPSRDLGLRDRFYKEYMYICLVTILLVDFPCFLLNYYIVYCDSPEDVDEPMFHLASWQTLALTSSLVSVLFSFVRLLWLNYRYCKIFGCALLKGDVLSLFCVWTSSLLAYLALAAMLFFFFGQFVPEIMLFNARQAKLTRGRNVHIVPVTKAITFRIQDVYHYADRTEFKTRKVKESLFHGIYSNELRKMENNGILVKEDKRCADIFYHVKPKIITNHVINQKNGKFDVSTTEYFWQWEGKNCSAIKNNSGTVMSSSCQPVWFEIEPVWCNFTYRIVYDQKNFISLYNVANTTNQDCKPVRENWITTVVREKGIVEAKRWSYCEKAGRKWKPVLDPSMEVCQA